MRLGICTGANFLQEAQDAGFDYVEFSTWDLLFDQDDDAFQAVRDKVAAVTIPVEACNCFIPANIKVTGADVDHDAVRRHMDIVLRRAAQIGISVMVFGSGGARRAPEGFPLDRARAQYADAVRLAAETGARYGVTIALEPLNERECNIFHLVEEGCRIVEGVNHPHAQVLADLYHMMEMQEPFSHIVDAGPRLAHVHIDFPKDFPVVSEVELACYPQFVQALVQAGYQGRVSIESHSFRPPNDEPFAHYFPAARAYIAGLLPVTVE